VNLLGDADIGARALDLAEAIVARSSAPLINPPARVRLTGRAENARRLGLIPGVVAPVIEALSSSALLTRTDLHYPLLLRRPGFHTGQHFICVDNKDGLGQAARTLAADELLAIQYLDARGKDGQARKYRVMFIDGELYPLHLAISSDWKVHYFSAGMAQSAAYREEERRFLDDMPAVLGRTAMQALRDICAVMGLQYAGIDFALSPDGSVLLFEANATMVVFPPNPDPMWDYRRPAIDTVLAAATQMLLRHAGRL
jgi:glutathione synthase/RimK-type ligase-like ATP-grasp enzyme